MTDIRYVVLEFDADDPLPHPAEVFAERMREFEGWDVGGLYADVGDAKVRAVFLRDSPQGAALDQILPPFRELPERKPTNPTWTDRYGHDWPWTGGVE